MSARVAELPRFCPNTDALDFSGAFVVDVASGGDINAAIITCIAGLSGPVPMGRIRLAASGTYTLTTPILLKNFGRTGWIEIVTNTTLPALNTRIYPSTGTTLATVIIPDANNGVTHEAGASGWRLRGIKFTCGTTEDTHAFVNLGDYGIVVKPVDVPSRISIRQCWIAGNAAHHTRRFGVQMNGTWLEVADNYLVHLNMNGVDYSQQSVAALTSAGLGKFRIENNLLWRCSEGWSCGGAAQFTALGQNGEQRLVSDVTVRRNHMYMPLSYKGVELCANTCEFKMGRRVLIENNIFENSWVDGQLGSGAVIWSANQDAASDERYLDTCDFTFRYNWFKNVSLGLEFGAQGPLSPSLNPRRHNVHDNLWTGCGNASTFDPTNSFVTNKWLILAAINDIRIVNNTCIQGDSSTSIQVDNAVTTRLEIQDNIHGSQSGTTMFNSHGSGQGAFDFINGNGDCIYAGNVQVGTFTVNPGTNTVLASNSSIGFADVTRVQDSTVKYADLAAFVVTGTYAGKGADIAGLITNLNGVECPSGDLPT